MTNINRRDFTKRVAGTTTAVALGGVATQAAAKAVEPVAEKPRVDLEQRAAEWTQSEIETASHYMMVRRGTPPDIARLIIDRRPSQEYADSLAETLRRCKTSSLYCPWLGSGPLINSIVFRFKRPGECLHAPYGAIAIEMGGHPTAPGGILKTEIVA